MLKNFDLKFEKHFWIILVDYAEPLMGINLTILKLSLLSPDHSHTRDEPMQIRFQHVLKYQSVLMHKQSTTMNG